MYISLFSCSCQHHPLSYWIKATLIQYDRNLIAPAKKSSLQIKIHTDTGIISSAYLFRGYNSTHNNGQKNTIFIQPLNSLFHRLPYHHLPNPTVLIPLFIVSSLPSVNLIRTISKNCLIFTHSFLSLLPPHQLSPVTVGLAFLLNSLPTTICFIKNIT